jgi:hypothetical protein
MTSIANEADPANEEMWPSLNEAASPVRVVPQKKVAWDVGQDQEDWELLSEGDKSSEEESKAEESKAPVVQVMNHKLLMHAASSPDLRTSFDLKAVMEDEEHSFSMVSGPGSVMSISSNFSFRDAILSPPSPSPAAGDSDSKDSLQIRPRPKVKPRYVVTAIKRCAKSTGDLTSLVIKEDEEELGSHDAMEFYHRKALGGQSRKNGLKLRPDELARKTMILNKKSLQKQSSQG